MVTPRSKIRKEILKQRGVELKKHTRKPVSIDKLPTPYKKTRLMQLVELRHSKRLEELIFTGTIYEVEKRLEVDATTVSKWRALVTEARDKEFFAQFKEKK